MDAIDTTSTDLVILDAGSDLDEDMSFGKEVTKTLAISTATSAALFGGIFVIAKLTPVVKSWFDNRRKKNEKAEVAENPTETPETQKA